YRTTAVRVMPGPSGGHVWEPWSYSPISGLVYFPGAAGGSYIFRADPHYTPAPTDIGPPRRGRVNMGTGAGGGGGGGVVEGGGGRGTRPAGTLLRLGMRIFLRRSQPLSRPVAPILHLRLPMRRRFPRSAPMELTETFSTHGTRLRAKNDGARPAAAPE